MSTEKMREEFEAWAGQRGYSLERNSEAGGYYAVSANVAWSAWQASRATLVVELPPITGAGDHWSNVRDNTILSCKRAIEAADVRVKA